MPDRLAVSYAPLLTVTKTSDDGIYQSAPVSATSSGSVHIRVSDANNDQGNQSLDTLFVDHMLIVSEAGAPPSAPTELTAVATCNSTIDLSWTDESSDEDGFEIERWDGVTTTVATVGPNINSYEDSEFAHDVQCFVSKPIVRQFWVQPPAGWVQRHTGRLRRGRSFAEICVTAPMQFLSQNLIIVFSGPLDQFDGGLGFFYLQYIALDHITTFLAVQR